VPASGRPGGKKPARKINWFLVVVALVLLGYGASGLYLDDITFPYGKHARRTAEVHLHGVPAWALAGAMFCIALCCLCMVVGNYQGRSQEAGYKKLRNYTIAIGASLYFIAWALNQFVYRNSTRPRAQLYAGRHRGRKTPHALHPMQYHQKEKRRVIFSDPYFYFQQHPFFIGHFSCMQKQIFHADH
jgi:hypothetical protein